MTMKIKFLGATGTVTGSKYLLQSGTTKILLDCGTDGYYSRQWYGDWSGSALFNIDVERVLGHRRVVVSC